MPMLNALASLMVFWIASGLVPPLEQVGRFDPQRIPESSGIVKSRRYPGIYWVHNDSGNPPLLFAIRGDGRIVRQFHLGFPDTDWEDIKAGRISVDGGWRIYSSGPGLYASVLLRQAFGRRRYFGARSAAPLLPPWLGRATPSLFHRRRINSATSVPLIGRRG